jgi:hypothetical protein
VSGIERGSLGVGGGGSGFHLGQDPQRVVTRFDAEEGAEVFVAALLESGYEQIRSR